MVRLVYYYVQHRAAPIHSNPKWSPEQRSRNGYASTFFTEGAYTLFNRMLEEKIVDEVLMIIESMDHPGVYRYDNNLQNFTIRVVPEIAQTEQFLRPNDIIYIRGGFKQWWEFIDRLSKKGHWILFYRANTNRGNWLFWDVVFEDLSEREAMDRYGRAYLHFIKPTSPSLFHPMEIERPYDVCIGASHIHDKKGQWRGVQAMLSYRRLFGKDLRCILPGRVIGGARTRESMEAIPQKLLPISLPGMLQREQMGTIYNQSKLFVHLGTGGQNDRGPLEAMRCGTPVMIAHPPNHAPLVYKNPEVSAVFTDHDNFDLVAREIFERLQQCTEENRKRVFQYHEETSGIEQVILPRMSRLFNFFRQHPVKDKEALRREYGL